MIQALPESLKFICHNGAGYDDIDINACTERGLVPSIQPANTANSTTPDIRVANTPIAVNDATADVAMFLILGALRRITHPFQSVRQGTSLSPPSSSPQPTPPRSSPPPQPH